MADVTVVGVFRSDDAAKAALQELDAAGFPPDRVGVVANNVRQAREVAGSSSPAAAIVGSIVGGLVGLGFGLATGMSVNSAAATVGGVIMFAIIGGFIGMLAGRTRALNAHGSDKYERAVDLGDALVTIRCAEGQQDQARKALQAAGATAVRVEGTPETV